MVRVGLLVTVCTKDVACLSSGTICSTIGLLFWLSVQSQLRCMKTPPCWRIILWSTLWSECCRLYRSSTSHWRRHSSRVLASETRAHAHTHTHTQHIPNSYIMSHLCGTRELFPTFVERDLNLKPDGLFWTWSSAYSEAAVMFAIYWALWAFSNVSSFFILKLWPFYWKHFLCHPEILQNSTQVSAVHMCRCSKRRIVVLFCELLICSVFKRRTREMTKMEMTC